MSQHITKLDILVLDILVSPGSQLPEVKGELQVAFYVNDKRKGFLFMSKEDWEGFKRHIVHAKIDEVGI